MKKKCSTLAAKHYKKEVNGCKLSKMVSSNTLVLLNNLNLGRDLIYKYFFLLLFKTSHIII